MIIASYTHFDTLVSGHLDNRSDMQGGPKHDCFWGAVICLNCWNLKQNWRRDSVKRVHRRIRKL